MVKPLVSYQGGKTWAADRILAALPAHTCYVEPFCGMAGVFCRKPRSKVEVLNDVSGNVVTAFRCVKYHADELLRELDWHINSRQQMRDTLAQKGLTDIQRSARWLANVLVSFGAGGESYGVQKKSGGGASTRIGPLLERIRELHARFEGVNIENLDWERCVRLYDSAETFFFMDPPYEDASSVYGGWKSADMERLDACLKQVKGKFLVTLNWSESNARVFRGWRQEKVERAKAINGKRPGRYLELFVWSQ